MEFFNKTNMHFKVSGTRHSFNDIADTDGYHISLIYFNKSIISDDNKNVIVGAGVDYTSLMHLLAQNKLAL